MFDFISFRIYFFGLFTGIKSLIFGRKYFLRVLEAIIIPVNYWRAIEYQMVLSRLNLKKGQKVLDVGSPKMLSLFVAKKFQVKVLATDLFDYFVNYCNLFSKILGINSDYFSTKVEDARKLTFLSNSFDKIISVSVIEHIPKNGDTLAVKEFARVLKKGGLTAITVPCADSFRIEYRKKSSFYYSGLSDRGNNEKVFYQRVYSRNEIMRRIVKPSNLKLVSLEFAAEKVKPFGQSLYYFLPKITGPFHPSISLLNHYKTKDVNEVKGFGMACIVLMK